LLPGLPWFLRWEPLASLPHVGQALIQILTGVLVPVSVANVIRQRLLVYVGGLAQRSGEQRLVRRLSASCHPLKSLAHILVRLHAKIPGITLDKHGERLGLLAGHLLASGLFKLRLQLWNVSGRCSLQLSRFRFACRLNCFFTFGLTPYFPSHSLNSLGFFAARYFNCFSLLNGTWNLRFLGCGQAGPLYSLLSGRQ